MLSNTKSVDHRGETDSYLTTSFNELFFNPTQKKKCPRASGERAHAGPKNFSGFFPQSPARRTAKVVQNNDRPHPKMITERKFCEIGEAGCLKSVRALPT